MPAKGQRRKQQIIETAKEMFMTQGFQSSHIGQVCDKLNIARGTVYQYFGNKREILYAILEEVQEQIEDIFDADDLDAAVMVEQNSVVADAQSVAAVVVGQCLDAGTVGEVRKLP